MWKERTISPAFFSFWIQFIPESEIEGREIWFTPSPASDCPLSRRFTSISDRPRTLIGGMPIPLSLWKGIRFLHVCVFSWVGFWSEILCLYETKKAMAEKRIFWMLLGALIIRRFIVFDWNLISSCCVRSMCSFGFETAGLLALPFNLFVAF